jgi:hypothetical protein
MSNEETLRILVQRRNTIKASLTRFKIFWETDGKIAAIETIYDWLRRSMPLIDKFLEVQDQIYALIAGTAEEEPHNECTQEFETLYYELVGEVRSYTDPCMNPKPSRC